MLVLGGVFLCCAHPLTNFYHYYLVDPPNGVVLLWLGNEACNRLNRYGIVLYCTYSC